MKRMIKIKFEEDGKTFFDSTIIGKDITEEQAQKLMDMGKGRIIEINENNNQEKKNNHDH